MKVTIVGGVYSEYCAWPSKSQILGSAGRAALTMVQLDKSTDIVLHTSFKGSDIEVFMGQFINRKLELKNLESKFTVNFVYDHPLALPSIYPREIPFQELPSFEVKNLQKDEKVVMFGMYERRPIVSADTVIYDPQSSFSPRLFSQDGSRAKHLIYILNRAELERLSKQFNCDLDTLEEQAKGLLLHEKAEAVVVKSGARGAYVCTSGGSTWVPAYKTSKVSSIGSGDAFVAGFAHYFYVKKLPIIECACKASVVAAHFVENEMLVSDRFLDEYLNKLETVQAELPQIQKKVYLAGPFFNVGQMWLINQCKQVLEGFGFDVFSPYHELGIDVAEVVASADIWAIEKCDILYALFDDHDPGTLFEIGYAISAGKKAVIYAESSTDEHLKMFHGSGCTVERDFTTSIYKLSWELVP